MEDQIIHAMMKAREAELKMKSAEPSTSDTEQLTNTDSTKV